MHRLFLPVSALILTVTLFNAPTAARTIRDHRDPSRGGGAYTLGSYKADISLTTAPPILGGARGADTGYGISPSLVPPIFEMKLTFAPGQTRSCETRNLTEGADPVLHLLLGPNPNGRPVQVATDDDSAGAFNARISLRSSAGGVYLLIMRAAGAGATGKAELWCDGRVVAFNLPVGGAFKRIENLRAGEQLQTVTLPGGPLDHVLYLLDDDGNVRQRLPSAATDSVIYTAAASDTVVALVGSRNNNTTDLISLVRNDAPLPGHDSDGDGLGNELEKAVGTCSNLLETVGNWDCARSVDPKDTDSDGLSDAVELLGELTDAPYQHLPRWGANPLHKDLFVEVDYGQRTPGDADWRMSPENARAMAEIYGDPASDAQGRPQGDPVLHLLHAQSLKNPDGQPGISLHFDTGLVPTAGAPVADYALYGDWGGHSVVGPVKKDGKWVRADPAHVRSTSMVPRRRPYFQYALGDPTSSGQADVLVTALNLPLGSPSAAAHELGHTLGLDHFGPRGVELKIGDKTIEANCKPNYPSIMSYAYLDVKGAGFADGYGRTPLNNVNLSERNAVAAPRSPQGRAYLGQLHDVFGFPVDMSDGSVDWNRDGIISAMPVRAYANENGAGCELTRANAVKSPGLADGAVSLARLGHRTFVAYIDERDSRLHLSRTDDPFDCLKFGDSCGSLSDSVPLGGWNKNMRSVDMATIATPNGPRILVILRSAESLHEAILDESGSVGLQRIIASPFVATELSLASNGATSWLATRDPNGTAALRTRGYDGAWSGPSTMVNRNTGVAFGIRRGSTPALAWTSAEGGRLYAALPVAPDGEIVLRYLSDDGRWGRPGWGLAFTGTKSTGRPAIAVEPVVAGAPLPSRVRIAYLSKPNSDGQSVVRLLTLAAKTISPSEIGFRDGLFDNPWYYARGVDLLFEPGIDDQLRAAVATALVPKGKPAPHHVELRPLAGGILNLVQRNWDDWEALGFGLCLVRQEGGSQMLCANRPYDTPGVTTGIPAPLFPPSAPIPQPHPTPRQCPAVCPVNLQQCIRDVGSLPICRQRVRLCQRDCR
jgi:hypothetical protein